MKKLKRAFIDIETLPNISATWEYWETNVVWVIKDWCLASVAIKEPGKKPIVKALPDFKGYKKGLMNADDYNLCVWLHKEMSKYDILIAQNGDAFDFKKIKSRFVIHRLPPVKPFKTIDTKKIAKKEFGFNSNSQNELARYFGIEEKLHTTKELWKDCGEGDMKAWKKMKAYNAHDTVMLEKIYLRMRGFSTTHPNLNLWVRENNCPTCLSSNIQMRGREYVKTGSKQRYQCMSCDKWFQGELEKGFKVTFT